MKAILDIFRKRAEDQAGRRETHELAVEPGDTLLDAFHRIQAERDPSFAYRDSCRGAICGSCAVHINGVAALACKTQVAPLAAQGTIVVDPLGNLPTIKDLVADLAPFWEAFAKVRPYLMRPHDAHDARLTWDDKLSKRHLDQLERAIVCIKCAACLSDCPKRAQDARFIGPAACVALYKFFVDPRDAAHTERVAIAREPNVGVVACDSHGNCVKVCPKDVRPLRAINMIRQDLPTQE
jgi:succinate dehydrogenase / fumarate reductase iron-sulfur subunit